jgi:hypothetical protein
MKIASILSTCFLVPSLTFAEGVQTGTYHLSGNCRGNQASYDSQMVIHPDENTGEYYVSTAGADGAQYGIGKMENGMLTVEYAKRDDAGPMNTTAQYDVRDGQLRGVRNPYASEDSNCEEEANIATDRLPDYQEIASDGSSEFKFDEDQEYADAEAQ